MDLLEAETIAAMLFVAGLLFSIVLASIPAPKKATNDKKDEEETEKTDDREPTRERSESFFEVGPNATACSSSVINPDPI